ncbi:MAG: hypothetical protein EOQ90_16250 [Mesorhizobium sp.]|nr:hypothetical protein [Mesorhizobium sp.]RWI09041.1 MAG: hypothetical protein EOQ90_16250 [Mesorhizobium sp.]RWM79399.1 MAG: hypothetical protein EOR83_29325 [Mesorhizobium sp.]
MRKYDVFDFPAQRLDFDFVCQALEVVLWQVFDRLRLEFIDIIAQSPFDNASTLPYETTRKILGEPGPLEFLVRLAVG